MAPRSTTAESEGAMTDDDVHLSPSSACSSVYSGGGGGSSVYSGGGGGGRIKILCSFGGRIMPRPSDGALKYIGGETRVLAMRRSIPFCDVKRKVEEMFKTEVAAIKYQLLADELDVFVSVTCDEDLAHMLDEYDRFEAKRSPSASPRFRVYVFPPQTAALPSAPAAAAAASSSSRHAASYAPRHQQHRHLFQAERYVATVPVTPNESPRYPDHQPNGAMSAGNSPRADALGSEQAVFRSRMQRVRSSPNLGGLDAAQQQLHQHAAEVGGGGLAGYMSGSPGHAGAGHAFFQGNNYHHYNPQPQYSPAPMPVPVPRGYVRGGSSSNYMAAPMIPAVRSGRPVTRGGAPYGEMHTAKATTIWD